MTYGRRKERGINRHTPKMATLLTMEAFAGDVIVLKVEAMTPLGALRERGPLGSTAILLAGISFPSFLLFKFGGIGRLQRRC
jgi:hypothetical protein